MLGTSTPTEAAGEFSGFAAFGFPVVRIFRLGSVVAIFLFLLLNAGFAFRSFFFTVCHLTSLILV